MRRNVPQQGATKKDSEPPRNRSWRASSTAVSTRRRPRLRALVPHERPAPGAGRSRTTQQRRRGPMQLRALAGELDAREEAKCQKREIDLVQDPADRPDETQKSERSGKTSQGLSRPPFQPRDRF